MILRRILNGIFWFGFGMFLYLFPHYAIRWWLRHETQKLRKEEIDKVWGEAINSGRIPT